ncbi:hypothetical protein LINPERHAP2_LOCUS15379, partial [Linum perenne]
VEHRLQQPLSNHQVVLHGRTFSHCLSLTTGHQVVIHRRTFSHCLSLTTSPQVVLHRAPPTTFSC